MGRKLGSKNKNINTAKNKNIININVNSSKSKRGRGRPKKQSNDTTQYRQSGGMGGMAPPQVIISQPQPAPQQDNSLLSSFITSRMLNESNSRTNMTNIEPQAMKDQPSYFNARESIIPKFPDTPLKQEMKQEIKPPTQSGPPPQPAPPRPPAPPAPPPKMNDNLKGLDLTGLKGMDAVTAELKYLSSEEGKAEKARKKAEAAAKKEAKKLEKETAPQPQSTTDFLNMTFTPPKRDIVEMMTPSKERTSTAITPYKGTQSTLEFLIGGTPQKTEQQLKTEKNTKRLKELKSDLTKPKKLFEYNDLKTELTGQPNPNKDIARSIIGKSIIRKAAAEKANTIKIEEDIKQLKHREEASNRIKAATKTKLIKQFKEAKKELRPQNVGQPLVVRPNTKELILKKNRDRGIKAQQAAASKKRSSEQEKIINFSKFMMEQNKIKTN